MSMRKTLIFFVNDQKFELENVDPDLTLVSFLRSKGLTGAKVGCLEGVCGSCTVVIGKWNHNHKNAKYISANACLLPIFWLDLCFVITVEGIGNPEKMHPVQERLSRGHGSQCGYCSPGFVMAMYALLRNNPYPEENEIRQALKGNLCRCTGYRPIIEAFNTFSSKNKSICTGCPGQVNGQCCQIKSSPSDFVKDGLTDIYEQGLTKWKDFQKYDPTQELVFPPELIQTIEKLQNEEIFSLQTKHTTIYCPKTLKYVKNILQKLSTGSKIYHVSSGQALRFDLAKSKNTDPSVWISYNKCEEMRRVELKEEQILIGAALSLSEVREALARSEQKEKLKNLIWLLDEYSSIHVGNVATWTGSLLSAFGDFPALALALNLKIYIQNFDTDEISILKVGNDFFDTYKTKITGNTIITHAVIDLKEVEVTRAAKFDPELRSLINLVEVECTNGKNRIALNGFEKFPILVENVKIDDLEKELKKLGIPEEKLEGLPSLVNMAKQEKKKEEGHFETLQLFQPIDNKDGHYGSVGRPLAHQYADRHTTGDARYVEDLKIPDLLHLALVLSEEAHAEIVNVDTSEALKLKGVVAYVDINDIPTKGTNVPGTHPMSIPPEDTPIFADKLVISYGQTIGAIIAETPEIARKAAKLVKVEYKKLKPIVTIQDAVEAKSYFTVEPIVLKQGEDPDDKFKDCAHVVEGKVYLQGQQHAYMEPQSAICVPEESGEWTIHTATQSGANAQLHAAVILGIGKHKINVRVKRLGGGFGGKAGTQCGRARNVALIAANKLKRPVSCVLTRYEDMVNTGGRHPALGYYKLGCDTSGKLIAGKFEAYVNGGYSQDCTLWVLGAVVATGDGTFHVPNIKYTGYACKTNTASNTAMRGFGQPQAIFIMEYAMDKLARKAGILPEKMRELNHAVEGQTRIDGHTILNDVLSKCWEECKKLADYKKLRVEIDEFNQNSTTRKRGLAMTASRFGLLHGKTFEQAFVLVQIYLDGTVGISIGGAEMGQGLNIKCLQVASQALNLPIDKITMIEVATDKTANVPVTGGSQGADIHGHAIKKACDQLMSKIGPLRKELQEKSWEDVVAEAYNRCIPLSAGVHGQFPREEVGGPSDGALYHTTGAVCTVVEIDITTGEHWLKSVDIVMDTGNSLNPAIDIGQIEGGFMQMYGHMTMEQVLWDDQGRLMTDSFRNYRLPTVSHVPDNFRVMLLKNPNTYPGAVYSSKGIGEPPLLLGASAFFAVKDAISSLAKNWPEEAYINNIEPPLTPYKVRKACDELKK
uniref:FAD-binding PCMH-type domain-containing protein n=1 Tax=Acrobeloides nanus TaxID=290746 RepID=A0A914DF20_9BILA